MAVATRQRGGSRQRGKQYRMRMTDFSDREVLALVDQAADEEGWAESAEIASELWSRAMSSGNGAAQQATHAVSTRLAYMARTLGVVVRSPDSKHKAARWGLTDVGEELLRGRLSKGVVNSIDRLTGTQTVIAVHQLTARGDDDMTAALMRRAWVYGTSARR